MTTATGIKTAAHAHTVVHLSADEVMSVVRWAADDVHIASRQIK